MSSCPVACLLGNRLRPSQLAINAPFEDEQYLQGETIDVEWVVDHGLPDATVTARNNDLSYNVTLGSGPGSVFTNANDIGQVALVIQSTFNPLLEAILGDVEDGSNGIAINSSGATFLNIDTPSNGDTVENGFELSWDSDDPEGNDAFVTLDGNSYGDNFNQMTIDLISAGYSSGDSVTIDVYLDSNSDITAEIIVTLA